MFLLWKMRRHVVGERWWGWVVEDSGVLRGEGCVEGGLRMSWCGV